MSEINYIKPIIKWVGGKTQIINDIMDNYPKEIENYHELFLGGGSVLLALIQNKNNKLIKISGTINAYDLNETLINMYKNIQKNYKKLYIEINKIIDIFNNINGEIINRKPLNSEDSKTSKESYYYWIRKQFNNFTQIEKNSIIGSAYFIFLNKTCFRGIYREGPNGFNVPYGHYKNPEIINKKHLSSVSKLITNVNFYHMSFENAFNNINKNDFIYLDPPYAPINNTSFVGYTLNGFTLNQHKTLFKMCKKYKFMMSNADVDLVKNSFNNTKKYTIITVLCKRTINSKKPDSKINEVIIKS